MKAMRYWWVERNGDKHRQWSMVIKGATVEDRHAAFKAATGVEPRVCCIEPAAGGAEALELKFVNAVRRLHRHMGNEAARALVERGELRQVPGFSDYWATVDGQVISMRRWRGILAAGERAAVWGRRLLGKAVTLTGNGGRCRCMSRRRVVRLTFGPQ